MTARTRQVEMSKDPLKTGTFDSASRDMEFNQMDARRKQLTEEIS